MTDDKTTQTDILKQYGVQGMHWGVTTKGSIKDRIKEHFRRSIDQKYGSLRSKPKPGSKDDPTNSPDHSAARALQSKKTHQLSNDELKKLTQRLQLEKQFKDLSKTDLDAGKKVVTKVLGKFGDQILGAATTLAVTYVIAAVKKAIDARQASS